MKLLDKLKLIRSDIIKKRMSEFEIYTIPSGMSTSDAFRVFSYLFDRDEMDNYELYGFKKIDNLNKNNDIDLFVCTDKLLLLKRNKYNFRWYTSNVTSRDIKRIYDKIGFDYSSLLSSKPYVMALK